MSAEPVAVEQMPAALPVRLEVWADIACPWCFIGVRKLDRVLAGERAAGREVTLTHRPYQLQPDLPAEGVAMRGFFEPHFGGAEALDAELERVHGLGLEVGISFDFAAMPKAPNTLAAHTLAYSYDGDPRQHGVLLALYSAYFERGLDITDREVLVDVVAAVTGEAADDVRERYGATEELSTTLALGRELGISSVPTFVADAGEPSDQFGLSAAAVAVSGAQPERTLAHLLEEARARAAA